MYRERTSVIAGAAVWNSVVGEAGRRVLPDGCMDLLWMDGELRVAGPDTAAYQPAVRPGAEYHGLRLPPGFGPTVFGVPADRLRDTRPRLADLWPGALARRLTDLVADAPDPGAALENIVTRRLRETPGPQPWVAAVACRMSAGASVTDTAAELALSERQLHRRCLDVFGYGPKTLLRILRLNRALDQVYAGRSPARAALDCGYADQAHFARETKRLAGVPVGELVHANGANRSMSLPSGSRMTA